MRGLNCDADRAQDLLSHGARRKRREANAREHGPDELSPVLGELLAAGLGRSAGCETARPIIDPGRG
jgi:hypothetical protein